MKDKKYYIPMNGQKIEVTEEVYRAYYQPVWRTKKRAQSHGECCCPKNDYKACTGDCLGCKYHQAGDKVSTATAIGGEDGELTIENTLVDDTPSAESILMEKELLKMLYEELEQLDPDGRRICELIMQGKSERAIAADMGKPQTTINYKKNKTFSILRKALKKFI